LKDPLAVSTNLITFKAVCFSFPKVDLFDTSFSNRCSTELNEATGADTAITGVDSVTDDVTAIEVGVAAIERWVLLAGLGVST